MDGIHLKLDLEREQKQPVLIAGYGGRHPNAMARLERSLAECTTCPKLPAPHRPGCVFVLSAFKDTS